MAVTALDTSITKTYTLKRDPDIGKAGATTFDLGSIPARVLGSIKDKSTSFLSDAKGEEINTVVQQNKTNIDIVSIGLRGWSNFQNSKGQDVPFETTKRNIAGQSLVVADDATMDMLQLEDIIELAEQILSINEVETEKKKKSAK